MNLNKILMLASFIFFIGTLVAGSNIMWVIISLILVLCYAGHI